MTTQTVSPMVLNKHRIRITIQNPQMGFYSAYCESCKKSLSCGFPYGFIYHSAQHHAGDCKCPGPDLTTWT